MSSYALRSVFLACYTCEFFVNGFKCRKFREVKNPMSVCDYYFRSGTFNTYYFVYRGIRSLFQFDSLTECVSHCEHLPGSQIFGVNNFVTKLVGRI